MITYDQHRQCVSISGIPASALFGECLVGKNRREALRFMLVIKASHDPMRQKFYRHMVRMNNLVRHNANAKSRT